MAFTALVPATINVTHRKGAAQEYRSTAVVDFAAAAINLTAYAALAAKLIPLSAGPTSTEVTLGTVTGDANGILKWKIAEADGAALNIGTAQVVITGQPVAGDDDQLLAQGTFQLSEG